MNRTPPMIFSVNICSPYHRWGGLPALDETVRLAEETGFLGVEMGQHIVVAKQLVPQMGTVWYDNFVLGAHIATLTKRLCVIFNVIVLPYYQPIPLAKAIATLDQVAQGRLIVGMGAGVIEPHFEAVKADFHTRGAVTNDHLAAMKALWTQEAVSYQGKYSSFANVSANPKCFRKPHARIWIGGHGPAAMRRVATFGDGWSPNGMWTSAQLANDVAQVKEMAKAGGRDPQMMDFGYRTPMTDRQPSGKEVRKVPADLIETLHGFQEAGFQHMRIVFPWADPKEYMGHMEWFAKNVMPAFQTKSQMAGRMVPAPKP